jgi:predicted dehydrogenase
MKFLVLGLGSMGKRRIRCLQSLGADQIVGYDPRGDRRAEAEAKYGIRTVADFAAGFVALPDAVIISTPPELHIPYAIEAARRGIHFFTEANVVDDGIEELLGLLRARPSLVGAPSCTMRYYFGPKKIVELVSSGAVGRPLTFMYQSGQYLPDWHPWEDYRSYYVSRRATGGCREIFPFELTWLVKAFGAVRTVLAYKGKLSDLDADIDDVYQAILEFDSGAVGCLQVDVVARAPVRHFHLLGAEGNIEWDVIRRQVGVYLAKDSRWTIHTLEQGTVEKSYAEWSAEEPYVEEIRDFLAAVGGGRLLDYTYDEDRRILDVLKAAEASHAEGRRIDLGEFTGKRSQA